VCDAFAHPEDRPVALVETTLTRSGVVVVDPLWRFELSCDPELAAPLLCGTPLTLGALAQQLGRPLEAVLEVAGLLLRHGLIALGPRPGVGAAQPA